MFNRPKNNTHLHTAFYVGGDTFFEGYTAGKEADTFLQGKGYVAILTSTKPNMQTRLKGFKTALRERQSDIILVDTGLIQSQYDYCYAYTSSLLEKYPNLDLLYLTGSLTTNASIQAIKDKNNKRVKIICHDLLTTTILGLEEEYIHTVIAQDPFLQAHDAPILLFNYITAHWRPEIKRISNQPIPVTKANYTKYWNLTAKKPRPYTNQYANFYPLQISKKLLKLDFITFNNHEFWEQIITFAEQAKVELLRYNAELTIHKQEYASSFETKSIIQTCIKNNSDGICLPVFETSVIPILKKAQKKGIPIVIYNTEISNLLFSESMFLNNDINLKHSLSAQILLNEEKEKQFVFEQKQRLFTETLITISNRLNSQLDETAILTILFEEIARVFSFTTGSLFIVEKDHLRVFTEFGYNKISKAAYEFINQETFLLKNYPTYNEILITKKPLLISDTYNDTRWTNYPETNFIRSWIGCPLIVDDTVIAIFSLDKDEAHYFTPQHVQQMQAFAGQASLALRNAQLFEKVSTLAKTDTLTGLLNRRDFENQIRPEFEKAHRHNRPLSLLMLDLDFFKKINDTYGHVTGDTVLKAFSANLKNSLRNSDIACRYGGEEFVILAPETDNEGGAELAERIRARMDSTLISIADTMLNITVSIGISSLNNREGNLEQLVDEADKALYEAKHAGRNAVFYWDAKIAKAVLTSAGDKKEQ